MAKEIANVGASVRARLLRLSKASGLALRSSGFSSGSVSHGMRSASY
jgi:hypothetical protein